MKLLDLFRKKKKPKPRPRTEVDGDGNLVVSVTVDGYDKFVEQLEEMASLVDVLSDKLERLGELTEPISVVTNNYNLSVNASDVEIEQL